MILDYGRLTVAGWGHWKTPSMGRAYSQNIYWLDDVKILQMRMKPNQISGKILKAEVLQARRDIEIIERFEEKRESYKL